MEYKGRKVLVCGMAKSGIAAAKLLRKQGALVTVQDSKDRTQLKEADALEQAGISLYTGKNPDDIILKQDLVVLSPGVPVDLPFVKMAKERGIPVIGEVELAYTLTPCPVIAITGTNGKTTTTALTGEILQAVNPQTAVVGNIGIPYCEKVESLTTDSVVVAEISSFQMETAVSFHPHISAVLNISPDHLNRHKTMENYIAMKERVFANQTEGDTLVLNYEDDVCRAMAEKTKAQVIFFSSKRHLQEGLWLENGAIRYALGEKKGTFIQLEELQLLGTHNYENVMAASAIAFAYGVPVKIIRKVLQTFRGVAHRIEFVETVDGVDYYNDSKGTNTDAAIRALLAMKKPVLLIGGGYDKGADFDDWTKLFSGRVKEAVFIGATAEKLQQSAEKFGFTAIKRCNTFRDAVEQCRKDAQPGDCVLLSPACASWDMFTSYEERGDLFKQMVHAFSKETVNEVEQ